MSVYLFTFLDALGQHQRGRDDEREAASDDTPKVDTDPKELLNTAKDLRKRGEALLLKNLGGEDAEEVRELLRLSAAAIGASDWDTLQEKNDVLSDLLFYLED